ncbi:GNAT family N-acetyltransferase [Actinoplanes subtropicus]|uniref:GNAT family N-acetyltransferase n=1 Tax=Actinoplanes subtropicus TaxID=543632 RepID=UPI0004C320F3|nr:GNAT family N-acetyltransferase [Actinoplanes subtropicus]
MTLSADEVTAAVNAWLWFPPDAQVVDTADLLLINWPDYFKKDPSLMRFTPTGEIETAFNSAAETARSWGFRFLVSWVRLDAPDGFEDLLRHRGVLDETLDIFALELGAGRLSVDFGDFEIRWRNDLESSRDFEAVGIAAFAEGSLPDDATLTRLGTEAQADYRAGRGGHVLVYDGDRAIGAAGLTMAGTVARLWGGGVIPEARGRGAYRAMVAARLKYAVERGATVAVVKGRIETSGPILRRLGFEVYGQERSYLVKV